MDSGHHGLTTITLSRSGRSTASPVEHLAHPPSVRKAAPRYARDLMLRLGCPVELMRLRHPGSLSPRLRDPQSPAQSPDAAQSTQSRGALPPMIGTHCPGSSALSLPLRDLRSQS